MLSNKMQEIVLHAANIMQQVVLFAVKHNATDHTTCCPT